MVEARVREDGLKSLVQLERHQMFEKQSPLVVEGSVQRPPQERVANPEVEEEQLAVTDQVGAIRAGPGRHPKGEERVFEHLEVAACGLVAESAILREVVDIQDPSRRRRHEVEKA